MRYKKRKKIVRKSTKIHISTPLFHYWERYGWKQGVWGLGISKQAVDLEAERDGLMDITYWKFNQVRCVKAKTIQKYPVERIKGGDVEVYIIPVTLLKPEEQKNEEIQNII